MPFITTGDDGRISGKNAGDEDSIACSGDGLCAAAYMHASTGGPLIFWAFGDPADLGPASTSGWRHHSASKIDGWRNVTAFSGNGGTTFHADPAMVAIPQVIPSYPPFSLVFPPGAKKTPHRLAVLAKATGSIGSGVAFEVSTNSGRTFDAAPGVDASAGALPLDADRDKSACAVDADTGAVFNFFTVRNGRSLDRYVRWVFAGPGASPTVTMLGTPHKVRKPAGPGPGGHVGMAIAHRIVAARPPFPSYRIPVVMIAQASDKLMPCFSTNRDVTWELAYKEYRGTEVDQDNWDPPVNWNHRRITSNVLYRTCAAPDAPEGMPEPDQHYKVNPVPQLATVETSGLTYVFVAFPETDQSQPNGLSNIHVWSTTYDENNQQLSEWRDSVPSPSTTTNQWRPTLASSLVDGTVRVVVQWMEADWDGVTTAPRTRPRANQGPAAVFTPGEAPTILWDQPFALVPPIGNVEFSFSFDAPTHGQGVDYSSATRIPPHARGAFPLGGVVVTWSDQRVPGPFTKLFATAIAF